MGVIALEEHPLKRVVQERYATLSPAHKRVADFLTAHWDEAAFLTVEVLARRARVSPATVVRFSGEMGQQGFASLQQVMRDHLVSRLSPGYRASRLAEQLQPGSPAEVARRSLELDHELVNQLRAEWDDGAITRATQLLVEAKQILVAGFRISAPVARNLTLFLSQLRPGVHLLDGASGDLPEQVLDLGPADLLIAVGLGPRYWQQTLQVAAWARERGAAVVAVSDSPVSPIAALANVALSCPHQGLQFQFSLVPATMLVNALVNSAAAAMPKAESGVKQRLAQIVNLAVGWKLMIRDFSDQFNTEEESDP